MMDEYNSGCFRFHWLQIKRQINLEVMHSLNTRDMKAAYKQADGKKLDNRRVLVDVERGRTAPNWQPHRLGSGLGTTRIGGKTSIKSILGGRGKDLMKREESESGRNLVSVLMNRPRDRDHRCKKKAFPGQAAPSTTVSAPHHLTSGQGCEPDVDKPQILTA